MELESKKLKEERSLIFSEVEAINELAKTEKRSLTDEESTDVDAKLAEIDALDVKIKRAEKLEEIRKNNALAGGNPVNTDPTPKEERELSKWSLFKAVNEVRSGKGLTGLEAEMHQEAEKENRGVAMDGIGIPNLLMEERALISQGSSDIAPSVLSAYVDTLKEKGLYNKVGITHLGTMAANTVIPLTGDATVAWAAENANVTEGGSQFTKKTLSPKRLAAVVDVSNVLLQQNGPSVERAILANLGQNAAVKIDAAMFGSANVTDAPGAIATTSGVLTFTEAVAPDLAGDALEAIQTLADDHGLDGALAFVYNWAAYSGLSQDAVVASVKAAMNDDKLLGRPVHFSAAPASVAGTSADGLFGDFSTVMMAEFGPKNIIIDQYTQAGKNAVRLVMNNMMDFAATRGNAFVKFTSLI